MNTATETNLFTAPVEDVVQRHLKRTLPCKLDREELTDIAISAAKKRRHLRELESDLDAEKKRRKQQIDELAREIEVHDRELDTEEQERVVLCDLIFRAGMVYIRRRDTMDEIEPRPANAQEAQRFLPAVESTLNTPLGDRAPLLDQALAAQGGAAGASSAESAAETDEGIAGANDEGEGSDDHEEHDGPEDDGLTELTPAQIAAKESSAARKARRAAGGKGKARRASGKGKGK